MSASQRIAIVWNHPSRLLDCSFRFEQYLKGFLELGHDAVVACSKRSAEGFAGPVLTVDAASALGTQEFWRKSGARVVVAITWHRMARMLAAAGEAGAQTIAIADSDGRVGLRSHPSATLDRSLAYARSPGERVRCVLDWLRRYAFESRSGSSEDREYLASTESSDSVVLGNRDARREFGRFLRRSGRQELERRVHVVPFTVASTYLSETVGRDRADRVVAVGRWDDAQKDADLLARAVADYLSSGATTEVLIVGNETSTLQNLAHRFSSVRTLGRLEPDRLAEILGEGRSILFSSRWEGSPHAGFEALAMGNTVVGPPIPFVRSCAEEGFGTAAADRRPSSLASALNSEREAWNGGRRSAPAIAAEWRDRLEPRAVCEAMLSTLESGRTVSGPTPVSFPAERDLRPP